MNNSPKVKYFPSHAACRAGVWTPGVQRLYISSVVVTASGEFLSWMSRRPDDQIRGFGVPPPSLPHR